MHEARMNFVCPDCKKATVTYIRSLKTDTFECCYCHKQLYADALPKLAYKLSKEFQRLCNKHAHIYFYTKIEFEQDYKQIDDGGDFFIQELNSFQENKFNSPRFEILAYQFKCMYSSARVLIHDDSIAHPEDYSIPASYSYSYKFSEVLDEPSLPIWYKNSYPREREFERRYLLEFADLVHYTRLYNAYLRLFSRTHKAFASLEC